MYINDFSMYQCILVCVCVRWCTSINIYINVCSWVFNGYLNAYSKAYFDESVDMCIFYIYISYIIIRIYTYFPTPNSPSNWSHFLWTRHQASTNTFATSTLAVSTNFCGSRMFQVNSVVLLGFAVNQWLSFPCQPLPFIAQSLWCFFSIFPPCRQKKTLRFSLALQMGTPINKMQFNGNTWKHHRKIMIDDDQPWDLRFSPQLFGYQSCSCRRDTHGGQDAFESQRCSSQHQGSKESSCSSWGLCWMIPLCIYIYMCVCVCVYVYVYI